MRQRLADALAPLVARLTLPLPKQPYTPRPQQPERARALKLGIQLGGVYKLKTRGGFLIVQVLEFRRKLVVVKEVEDVRRFHANPANLSEMDAL